ncbi:segregation and condensation protein B [Corynebacterium kutscheri]|uniref:Segregation and condensation protein B n=1 Tax=Corynebacterium kutscheri TaxID=35755 RepID=A0A0F6TDD7_9CORY|nr:SMC-Scp complex subunit ScpB [Corynebacterium kutscheri]AKE41159.1 segregation and condensation protein B [Corynebacterium kutscheri]VEH07068.1 segregation and condensation protein B [Corynebacterium kutscheri]VEH09479.1 segregation and condensation protein B [Corynebacterium kutscheri]VEH79564.1 segregation and condensation protein B [Corynebacterium kutscheri]
MISQLRSQVESILLVIDTPVSVEQLAQVTEYDSATILSVLRQLAEELKQRGSGIEARETPEGWRLYTVAENAAIVEKFLLHGSQTKLSRAALETLAVVAYRQPATRAQVSAIRGVNVDGVMRTLQLRGLIREVDMSNNESAGAYGAMHYETTELFLELLGIDSLAQLPDLAPLLPNVDSIDEVF